MRLTDLQTEADRIMTICNACRYCEGHCAVFPAMEKRLAFDGPDLDYLANLCHNCGSCYHHCQYADPHEFDVNVPAVFADLRQETYGKYAWPRSFGRMFQGNGLKVTMIFLIATIAFVIATAQIVGSDVFGAVHPNGFYGVMPHGVMAGLFMAVSLFVLIALIVGMVRYWRALSLPSIGRISSKTVARAVHNAFTLIHLDGGSGDGCTYPSEAPSKARRVFHHLTFYGFLLCFAATSVGTVYHYLLDWIAPYDFASLPKILGISGGLGLIIGPLGLMWLKSQGDDRPKGKANAGMDLSFLVLLLLTSLTGMGLMLVKDTGLLGLALTVHLGTVLALFLTMPYGKFVHGFYRIIALIAHEYESEQNKAVVGQTKTLEAGDPIR